MYDLGCWVWMIGSFLRGFAYDLACNPIFTYIHWSSFWERYLLYDILYIKTESRSYISALKNRSSMINSHRDAYTLGSHSGVSVRRASGQDSCSEELGRLAVPQQRKWRAGCAARHNRRFVAVYSRREREFAYQIPRFIYNDVLSFTSWYIGNMPCASFYERKLLNFKNYADHRLAPCQGLISGRFYKPGVYRRAIQCISPLH